MKRLVVVLAVLLAGCAGFSKVGPGPQSIGGKMTVALDGAWNRFDAPGFGPAELWTREGLPLDNLVFYPGIKDGAPLGEVGPRKDKEVPKFKSAMQPHDIVELVEAYATLGGNAFKLERLAPEPFLGGQGFRFEFTLTRKGDEVVLKGVGFGAVQKGELFMMIYRAPRLHYFQQSLPAVEAIARSAKLSG